MGKASIVYVVGLSMILAYSLLSVSAASTSSMDNYTSYYGHTMAHNIAITGANIGTSLLMGNAFYSTNLLHQAYGSGYFDMYIDKPENAPCELRVYSNIEVSGETIRDTVIATFKFTPFSKYGWFTDYEKNGYKGSPFHGASDWKITGDSVFGAAHTNGHFNLAGSPYFNDKVTATTAPTLTAMKGVKNPIYKAGYEWGVTVPRLQVNLANLQGAALSDGFAVQNTDALFNFLPGGYVNIKIPPTTGATRNDTVPISSVTHNGVMAVINGNLHVKGTYQGQITVAALGTNESTGGSVYVDGNGIFAQDNPMANPNSNDMLGIVSSFSTYIAQDLTRNESSLVTIQAAVYCDGGELTAQNFWTIPKSGRCVVYGSVVQQSAGSLGEFNQTGLLHGMYYTIRHDERMNFTSPPEYPISGKYELVTWWEN